MAEQKLSNTKGEDEKIGSIGHLAKIVKIAIPMNAVNRALRSRLVEVSRAIGL